jgi:CCR4-NOT transcription complex subunit 1
MRPFTFALDVAALASRREYLNLDKWLADNVNAHRLEFIHSIFDFLDAKLKVATEAAAEGRPLALNPHTLVIFLRTLRSRFGIRHALSFVSVLTPLPSPQHELHDPRRHRHVS